MSDLPPMITTLDDRMAWAAYEAFLATQPIEECTAGPNYRDFKTERMVWDAVASRVIDAAAQFIGEIKTKAVRYDQMAGAIVINPEDRASHPIWQMRCDHCGRERLEAAQSGSTHCNAPFDIREHEWYGIHPSHRTTLVEVTAAQDRYFLAKNDMNASTFNGRSRTEKALSVWEALKKKYAAQDEQKT